MTFFITKKALPLLPKKSIFMYDEKRSTLKCLDVGYPDLPAIFLKDRDFFNPIGLCEYCGRPIRSLSAQKKYCTDVCQRKNRVLNSKSDRSETTN